MDIDRRVRLSVQTHMNHVLHRIKIHQYVKGYRSLGISGEVCEVQWCKLNTPGPLQLPWDHQTQFQRRVPLSGLCMTSLTERDISVMKYCRLLLRQLQADLDNFQQILCHKSMNCNFIYHKQLRQPSASCYNESTEEDSPLSCSSDPHQELLKHSFKEN